MDCGICFNKFNQSKNRPHVIHPCSHTFCLKCINKLKVCPTCRSEIKDTKPNWALLQMITNDSNNQLDKLRSEVSEKLDAKLKENKNKMNRLKDSINKKYSELYKQLQTNQKLLLDQVAANEQELNKKLNEIKSKEIIDDKNLREMFQKIQNLTFDCSFKPNVNNQNTNFIGEIIMNNNNNNNLKSEYNQILELNEAKESQHYKVICKMLLKAMTNLLGDDNNGTKVASNICNELIETIQPNNYPAHILMTRVYIKLEKYEKALDYLDKAFFIFNNSYSDPYAMINENDDSTAYCLKGKCLFSLKKYDDALNCYNNSIKLGSAEAHCEKAICLMEMNLFEQAVEFLDICIRLDSKLIDFYNNLKFDALFKLKRLNELLECCEKAIEVNPRNETAFNYKGCVLSELKKYDEAIDCFNVSISLDSNSAKFYGNKGATLYFIKKFDESLECLNKAIELGGYDYLVFAYKGAVLYEFKKYDQAIEFSNKSIMLEPNFKLSFHTKALSLVSMKRHEEAIESFNKIIEIDPEDCCNYGQKANSLFCLKKYFASIECAEKSIEINPNGSCGYFIKAEALFDLKMFTKSLEVSNKAIKIDPNHINAYELKADCHFTLKNFNEAIFNYDKVIQLNENNGVTIKDIKHSYLMKGLALKRQNLFKQAIECLEKLIQIDSSLNLNSIENVNVIQVINECKFQLSKIQD